MYPQPTWAAPSSKPLMTSCLPILNLKGLFLSRDESNFLPFWSIPVEVGRERRRAMAVSELATGQACLNRTPLLHTPAPLRPSPSTLLTSRKHGPISLPHPHIWIRPITKSYSSLESSFSFCYCYLWCHGVTTMAHLWPGTASLQAGASPPYQSSIL